LYEVSITNSRKGGSRSYYLFILSRGHLPNPVEGDNRFHNTTLLRRGCSECGVEKFALLPQETASQGNVKWKQHDCLPTGKLGTDGKNKENITCQ